MQRKSGKSGRPVGRSGTRKDIMSTDLNRKGIPHNTIRSEKQMKSVGGQPPRRGGPRRPS